MMMSDGSGGHLQSVIMSSIIGLIVACGIMTIGNVTGGIRNEPVHHRHTYQEEYLVERWQMENRSLSTEWSGYNASHDGDGVVEMISESETAMTYLAGNTSNRGGTFISGEPYRGNVHWIGGETEEGICAIIINGTTILTINTHKHTGSAFTDWFLAPAPPFTITVNASQAPSPAPDGADKCKIQRLEFFGVRDLQATVVA